MKSNSASKEELKMIEIITYNSGAANTIDVTPPSQTHHKTELDYTSALLLPYKDKWYSKLHYLLETFLVKHIRLHALFILYLSIWPRGLVILDMYTDALITYELYQKGHSFLFSLSCIFIITPFMLVWVGSLRFVQKFTKSDKFSTTIEENKHLKRLVNCMLFLYIYPPIGAIFMFLFELGWILFDIFNGLKAFYFKRGVVESHDRQFLAMKV